MKFKNIQTGSIIEPNSDFVMEQLEKSSTFVKVEESETVEVTPEDILPIEEVKELTENDVEAVIDVNTVIVDDAKTVEVEETKDDVVLPKEVKSKNKNK